MVSSGNNHSKSSTTINAGLIEKRLDIIQQISSKSEEYFKIVKDIILSMNPKLHNSFIAAMETVKTTIETLRGICARINVQGNDVAQALALGYDIYDSLGQINSAIDVIYDTVSNENYAKMALYNMSATFTTGVQSDKTMLLSLLEKYHAMLEDDVDIIGPLLQIVNAKANSAQIILYFADSKRLNKFMIELLRDTIGHVTGANKQKLLDIIEGQKDTLLGAKRINITYPGPQSPLVRYNLCPKMASVPIWELFEALGGKWVNKIGLVENLDRLAHEIGAAIIVIDKSSKSPIEFDIRGLVSSEYIVQNNLKISIQAGLNKKILERYNTVKELEPGRSLMEQAVTRILPPGAKRAAVIETLNGNLYRVVSNTDKLFVDIESINGLINGLSTRPMEYHKIHEEDIVMKCFDPKANVILTAYNEEKRAMLPSDVIKGQVIQDFMETYERKFDKSIPREPNDVWNVVTDVNEINQILLNRLTHTMGVHGKGSAEYTITYMTKFDSIIRQFIKELENRLKGANLTPMLFKEIRGEDLKKHVLSICKDILLKVVDELDRSRQWSEYDFSLKEYFLERKYIII